MLTIYLGFKIWVFEHFAESYPSTSNLAKISLSNGVPLLVLQKLSQYQPPVGNLLNRLPFHACRWYILEYYKISKILTKKFKSFWQVFVLWFLLISSLFLESVPQLDLVDDYVWLFLLSCVCYGISIKKNTKHHSYKKGKIEAKQLSSKTLQSISVCSTWDPWLKGLVHWRRWIQYVTLIPACLVYWIVFFTCTVWIISWRTTNIIKNQKCPKWGTLNFIRVVMHYMTTFQLGKCCWVSLSSRQTVMRIFMFAMKKGIKVKLCLRG